MLAYLMLSDDSKYTFALWLPRTAGLVLATEVGIAVLVVLASLICPHAIWGWTGCLERPHDDMTFYPQDDDEIHRRGSYQAMPSSTGPQDEIGEINEQEFNAL